jgi:hypothetical protein
MGTRSQGWAVRAWALLCVIAAFVLAGGVAHADPKRDIENQTKAAMESYDNMDYDAAKKTLTSAISAAKKAKLDRDPLLAKIHLYLGIANHAAGEADAAKAAFVAAVRIQRTIQIDAAYKSPELVKLLDAAREEAGTGDAAGAEECAGVRGVMHAIIDQGRANAEQAIEAKVAPELSPAKVVVMYRTEGTEEFVERPLAKAGACKYTGAIPAAAMQGSVLHYYVAAYDDANKLLAGKGSRGSPNIMELSAAAGGDTEDPINGTVKPPPGGAVSGGVLVGGKPPKVYFTVAGGTGVGYVTGQTEANNDVQECCVGNSLVVILPELGFFVTRQVSIGLAGRIGLPLGANVDPPMAKHSTVAPGAVLRVRYALSPSGEGLRVMGQVGGGVMRNTIKLQMQSGGGDTDIVAQGPLLFGAGVGFRKSLGSSLAFVADLSVLAGIAVVDKIGTSRVNSGVGADMTLGLQVGF